MTTKPPANAWRGAWLLTITACITAAVLAGVEHLTRERIIDQQQQAIVMTLNQVLPGIDYDNALHRSAINLRAPGFFRTEQTIRLYRAKLADQVTAVIFDIVTPDGYNGDIRLLIGIDRDAAITGVRVTQHRETPGLGDAIDAEKSDWIRIFTGLSLNKPDSEAWKTQRQGGEFSAISGATVTSNAVVEAVKRTLEYFHQHQTVLLQTAPENNAG